MTTAASTPPTPEPDSPPPKLDDKGLPLAFSGSAPCPTCGYSLHQMPRDGLCPECGARYTWVHVAAFPPLPPKGLLALDIGWPILLFAIFAGDMILRLTLRFNSGMSELAGCGILVFYLVAATVPLLRIRDRVRTHIPPARRHRRMISTWFQIGRAPALLALTSLTLLAALPASIIIALIAYLVR